MAKAGVGFKDRHCRQDMDQLLVLKNFKLDQLDVDPENSGGMIDKDQVVVRTPSPPSGSTHVNNNWIL